MSGVRASNEQADGKRAKMSEGDGKRRDNTGGSGSSGTTPPSVASIVDSTVRVLLPQLTERIEQQVSQAIKTALAAISTAIMAGGSSSSSMSTATLGCIPHSTALSGVVTFSAPKTMVSTSSSSSAPVMALTPLTPLADIVPGYASNLTIDAISVGPSSPPIPLKLAQKIWRNEFVELHELLPVRLGIPEPTLLDVLTKPENARPKKEIKTIQQWALCFNSYTTTLAMKQPHRLGDLLAYSSMIINASSEYEDTPWLQYNARFQRQAATDPNRPWAAIHASLWTTYFATARSKPQCRDCKETGHDSCQSTGTSRLSIPYRFQPYTTYRPICKKYNYSWCDLTPCNFQHIRFKCRKPNHRGGQCPDLNKNMEPFHPPGTKGT